MDDTIKNTFNAYWEMRYKTKLKIDFKLLSALCLSADDDLMDILKSIMSATKPYIGKDEVFTTDDWISLSDVCNQLYKQHIYHPCIFQILKELMEYFERRDKQRNAERNSKDM